MEVSKISKWLEEEVEYLIENYGNVSLKELENNLNRSKISIEKKIKRLNSKSKYLFWNDSEIEYLKENYGILNLSDLAKNLNHSKKGIKRKAFRLNLTKKISIWTEDEIEYLKENYGKSDVMILKDDLDRSKNSICRKAERLNLTENNFWTKEEVEYLKNNYINEKNDILISNLNRNLIHISNKANSLGLRRDHSLENSSNWKGGISFLPYCTKFNKKFKDKIRNEFNRECFICGITEKISERKLSIHHVNYNKDCLCNDLKCYFIPLCCSCHARTSFNRVFWEKLLTTCCEDPYMMEYFNNKYEKPIKIESELYQIISKYNPQF